MKLSGAVDAGLTDVACQGLVTIEAVDAIRAAVSRRLKLIATVPHDG